MIIDNFGKAVRVLSGSSQTIGHWVAFGADVVGGACGLACPTGFALAGADATAAGCAGTGWTGAFAAVRTGGGVCRCAGLGGADLPFASPTGFAGGAAATA
ncbi:MAG: hypothetical protein WBQ57_03795, partial [Rhodanobacteraceae bacterium]